MRCKKCGYKFEYHVYLGKPCPNCGSRFHPWHIGRRELRDWKWFIATIVFMLSTASAALIAKSLGFEVEGLWNVFLLFFLPFAIFALIVAWWLGKGDDD